MKSPKDVSGKSQDSVAEVTTLNALKNASYHSRSGRESPNATVEEVETAGVEEAGEVGKVQSEDEVLVRRPLTHETYPPGPCFDGSSSKYVCSDISGR